MYFSIISIVVFLSISIITCKFVDCNNLIELMSLEKENDKGQGLNHYETYIMV